MSLFSFRRRKKTKMASLPLHRHNPVHLPHPPTLCGLQSSLFLCPWRPPPPPIHATLKRESISRLSQIACSPSVPFEPPSSNRHMQGGAAHPRRERKRENIRATVRNQTNASAEENIVIGLRYALQFTTTNFLPLALVSGAFLGFTFPKPGQLAYQYDLSKWSTSAIFLLQGLALRTDELGKAITTWPTVLYGLASILLVTPLAATLVLQVHLVPRELITGLALFCCVPTTLSSGVALTQMAGGNAALALALTVISNLLGIVTMPFMISNLVASGEGVSISAAPLVKSLVQTLLLPLLLGKILRDKVPGCRDVVDRNHKLCSVLSTICLSLVPWMQISCSRALLLQVKAMDLAASIFLGMCLHLVFVVCNTTGMLLLGYNPRARNTDKKSALAARAVILTASQKTLPVMVAVVGRLGGALGEAGLLVLPCIAAHITQITIDSFLVNIWIQQDLIQKSSAHSQ